MDTLTPSQRRISMSHNRGKGTSPEADVRRLVYSFGYRYRLHRRDLPGCPDLVFSAKKKVIFVNGCFWHRHSCRKGRSTPATRVEFWQKKFEGTKARDAKNKRLLLKAGWSVLVIWECELRNRTRVAAKVEEFLSRN